MRLATLALLLSIGTADAATFQLDFTAHNFVDFAGNPGPPDVAGSFVYDTDIFGFPASFSSVSLDIANHTYTVPEVGFVSVGQGIGEIGGTLNGVNQVNGGTIDFFLLYHFDAPSALTMIYSDGGPLFWNTREFSAFSITELQTPLPGALLLFASGLGVLGLLRRRLMCG